jgi:hypothetical protein
MLPIPYSLPPGHETLEKQPSAPNSITPTFLGAQKSQDRFSISFIIRSSLSGDVWFATMSALSSRKRSFRVCFFMISDKSAKNYHIGPWIL